MTKATANSAKLIGRALLIGPRVANADATILAADGLQVELTPNPYAAVAELAGRPLVYRALILPLTQLFTEELLLVRVVKRRFPHVRVIASEIPAKINREDLRRLGVDAILSETAIEPLVGPARPEIHQPQPAASLKSSAPVEPVLTAEELRALLSDDTLPASGTETR